MKRISFRKVLFIVLFLFLNWFLFHSLFTIIIGFENSVDSAITADFGVVLGNKVHADGNPSDRLKGRLDQAVTLFQAKKIRYILVSGGQDPNGNHEVDVMKKYLIASQIPETAILSDYDGNNTELTARNSRLIAVKNQLHSVVIITQFYHILRCKLAFSKVGFAEIYSSYARYFELRDFYSLFREFFAFYKYLIMT